MPEFSRMCEQENQPISLKGSLVESPVNHHSELMQISPVVNKFEFYNETLNKQEKNKIAQEKSEKQEEIENEGIDVLDNLLLSKSRRRKSFEGGSPGNLQSHDSPKKAYQVLISEALLQGISIFSKNARSFQTSFIAENQSNQQQSLHQKVEEMTDQLMFQINLFGLINIFFVALQFILYSGELAAISILIIYPFTLLFQCLIKSTLFSLKVSTTAVVLISICFYQPANNNYDALQILFHGLLCLYLSLTDIQEYEKNSFIVFEQSKLLESRTNLIEQVFSTITEGIGVVNFAGTSFSNKTFNELVGDPCDSEKLMANMKKFKRDTGGASPVHKTNLFDDLKQQQKLISQNRSSLKDVNSWEYFTLVRDLSTKKKVQQLKYYLVFMSMIVYEGKMCYLLFLRDITSYKVFQDKQLIDSVKNRIFKSFTHELKSPLNFLSLAFELIQPQISAHPEVFKKLKKVIATAESCTNILRNIVNDFMDYSKLLNTDGALILNKKKFRIDFLIKRIEKIFVNQLKSQNVVFRVSIDPELPEFMFSDNEKLEQILLNLLLNSQKFTQIGWIKFKISKVIPATKIILQPSGQILSNNADSMVNLVPENPFTIMSQVQKSSSQIMADNKPESFIRFEVIDTGFGIEKERIFSIFNLFEHNQNIPLQESFKNKASAGLGLTISQNICQALGSHIRCKSKVGKGSVFYFDVLHQLEEDPNIKLNAIKANEQKQPTNAQFGGQLAYSSSFTVVGEEQLEDNEAVYLYHKQQIGKFNTHFEIPDEIPEMAENMEDDAFLRGDSNKQSLAAGSGDAFGSGADRNSNQDRLQIINSVSRFVQRKNKSSIEFLDYDYVKVHSAGEEVIAKMIQKRNSIDCLRGLGHDPDKFDINCEDDDNIVQIRVHKKVKTESFPYKSTTAQDTQHLTGDFGEFQHQSKLQNTDKSRQDLLKIKPFQKSAFGKLSNQNVLLDNSSLICSEEIYQRSGHSMEEFTDTGNKNKKQKSPVRSSSQAKDFHVYYNSANHDQYTQNTPRLFLPLKNPFTTYKLDSLLTNNDRDDVISIKSTSRSQSIGRKRENKRRKSSSQSILKNSFDVRTNHFRQEHQHYPQIICNSDEPSSSANRDLLPYYQPKEDGVTPKSKASVTRQSDTESINFTTVQNMTFAQEEEEKQEGDFGKILLKQRSSSIRVLKDQKGLVIQKTKAKYNVVKIDSPRNYVSNQDILRINSSNMYKFQSSSNNLALNSPSLQLAQKEEPPNFLRIKNFCCPEIMVVDDIDYNRFALGEIFSIIFDLEIIEACNGQDCIDQIMEIQRTKKCKCEGLRLIIMDYEMPILNGIQATKILCAKMASRELKQQIPIIALTAYNDEKQSCLDAGMKRFLTKPASAADISEILIDIINGCLY